MSTPVVCYLGWHGRGNIGDDAIREAVELGLAGARFVDLPLYPREIGTSLVKGLPLQLRQAHLVLGGGTCIGRRNWRRLVRFGFTVAPGGAGQAIGVGVEDPEFSGKHSYSDRSELQHWKRVLQKFSTVSVRGPRSAELLSAVGVEAPVVGDPALLLPRPTEGPIHGRIGVNLGFGDDLWGHDPKAVAKQVAAACGQLNSQGYEFIGILMNRSDRKWTEMALREVGGSAACVEVGRASQASAILATCSVVIVSRLHAAILASTSGTPAVSLEYQPKCRDFAMSIDRADSLLRTDALMAGDIVERVQDFYQRRAQLQENILGAVSTLRGRLVRDYENARELIGL